MNMAEVKRLLAAAASFDNRQLQQSTALSWQQAARAGRWTFDEAQQAIVRHYTESTEFLRPGHITELVRADRRERAMRRRRLPEKTPASREHIDAVLSGLAREMGWSRARSGVVRASCGVCGARPGERCTRPSRAGARVEMDEVHPGRAEVGTPAD